MGSAPNETTNQQAASGPHFSNKVTKTVRQLKEVIAIDEKGLATYLNDALAALAEMQDPSQEIAKEMKGFAYEVKGAYDGYKP
ncbi:hypothetical protein FRC08_002534 [Ceratobasidium sp. 394]|nr:hypothetical protein FRC08_002534 [Ceratobasidium sp. 394]KAG9089679.1 hypothetical protein FS749_001144 [Ceratobasidium sp. UAMH 11750]